MDDYLMLWKGPPELTSAEIEIIAKALGARAKARYPLPLEPDHSFTFVGVDVRMMLDGTIRARPSTKALGAKSHASFMPYFSYVAPSVKRGLVLGAAARVRNYTRPTDEQDKVLQVFTDRLCRYSGYPPELLDRWVWEGMSAPGR